MNNFDRVLRILQEQSDFSVLYTPYILTMVFTSEYTNQIEPKIRKYFPLDEDDVKNILKISSIINTTTDNTLDTFRNEVMSLPSPQSNDFALTILNKYFTSPTNIVMKNFLQTYISKYKIVYSDSRIMDLWSKFNKRFIDKPTSDV